MLVQRHNVRPWATTSACSDGRCKEQTHILCPLCYVEAENYSGLQCRTQRGGCGVARQDALQIDLEKRGPSDKLFQQSHFTTSLPWPYTISFLLLEVREWILFTFQPCPPFCQNLMMGNELLELDLRPPCLQMGEWTQAKTRHVPAHSRRPIEQPKTVTKSLSCILWW